MEENRHFGRYLFLFCFALFAIIVFFWASQQSRLELIQQGSQGEYSYQLLKQGDQKASTFRSSSSIVSKQLPKGSYQVFAQNGGGSFLEVASLKGFFRKTTVSIKPVAEHARVFVGKSPDLCMDSISNTGLSYSCPGGTYDQVKYHVPPTQKTPTYALNPVGIGTFVGVEGTFSTPGGSYMLMKNTTALLGSGDGNNSTSSAPIHQVFQLNSASDAVHLTDAKGIGLPGLDPKTTYSVRSFDDGFLVYTPDFSHMFYYASANAQPVDMSLGGPKTKGLASNQSNIDASNGIVLTTYSQGDFGETSGTNPKAARTEVVYGKPDEVKHFVINGFLAGAQLCGINKFCLLDTKNVMTVYDISGEKPHELYKVYNINLIQNTKNGLLAINKSVGAIFNFDIDKRTGYVDYSMGGYTFNRMQPVQNGYVISVTDNKKQEFALFVDATKPNVDSIDKKVLQIQTNPTLTVTPYGNIIYISPYIGSLAYNPNSKQYDYDPGTKAAAIAQMNKAVDDAGIDRKTYTIYSTVQ
jgi:hypothetical protein